MTHRVPIAAFSSILLATAGGALAEEPHPTDAETIAREYLEASGVVGSEFAAFLLAGMKQLQPEESELWDAVSERIDPEGLKAALAPIYVEHLAPDDMMAAIEFYRTPAGRRIAERQLIIAHENNQAVKAWLQEVLFPAIDELTASDINSPTLNAKRLHQTVADLRSVGDALMTWAKDQAERPGEERPVDSAGVSWSFDGTHETFTCSAVSYESIVRILVPAYLEAVPERDGWGNPYQYSVNADPTATPKGCMRSPGRDGTYETGPYAIGPYDTKDFDRDVVFAEGFFVTHPRRQE